MFSPVWPSNHFVTFHSQVHISFQMFTFPWNICQVWVVLLFFQKQLHYTSSDYIGFELCALVHLCCFAENVHTFPSTPRHIYITADKLRLNKLSRASTHASGVRLLFPPPVRWLPLPHGFRASKVEPWVASASVSKLLQMLFAAWVPS